LSLGIFFFSLVQSEFLIDPLFKEKSPQPTKTKKNASSKKKIRMQDLEEGLLDRDDDDVAMEQIKEEGEGCRRNVFTFDAIFATLMALSLIALLTLTLVLFRDLFTFGFYWLELFGIIALMFVVLFCGGLVVRRFGDDAVHFTRHLHHIVFYGAPLLLDLLLPWHSDTAAAWSLLIGWRLFALLSTYLALVRPVRTRFRFAQLCFDSIDRADDRPHTLKWLVTQLTLGQLVVVAFRAWSRFISHNLIAGRLVYFLPTLIVCAGDPLAAIVGGRWGTHRYRATAPFFSPRDTYTRSYEGSAAMLVSAIAACGLFYNWFLNLQGYLAAVIVVPFAMSVAESYAPHGFDEPMLFLIGCGLTTIAAL
jgi:dolichol kinase